MNKLNIVLLIIVLIGIGLVYTGLNNDTENINTPMVNIVNNGATKEVPYKEVNISIDRGYANDK